jgi:hypothetical protein
VSPVTWDDPDIVWDDPDIVWDESGSGSSMPLVTIPNIEKLVITELNENSDVLTVVGGEVHGRIPTAPTFPLAVVQRVGGSADRHPWIDNARIQFDVWAEKGQKSQAFAGAAAIHAALHALGGLYDDGVVTAVRDETVLQYIEDPETNRPRYSSVVVVTAHPLVTVTS